MKSIFYPLWHQCWVLSRKVRMCSLKMLPELPPLHPSSLHRLHRLRRCPLVLISALWWPTETWSQKLHAGFSSVLIHFIVFPHSLITDYVLVFVDVKTLKTLLASTTCQINASKNTERLYFYIKTTQWRDPRLSLLFNTNAVFILFFFFTTCFYFSVAVAPSSGEKNHFLQMFQIKSQPGTFYVRRQYRKHDVTEQICRLQQKKIKLNFSAFYIFSVWIPFVHFLFSVLYFDIIVPVKWA